MNEVTEEQELFYNFATERFRAEEDTHYTLCLKLDEFLKALTEHDKEIVDKIEEMIGGKNKDNQDCCIDALTEILTFIKEK